VLTEADSHLGLTNRLLAARARRVCLAFPIEGRNGDRYLLTGRPVPPAIGDRDAARAEFGIEPDELTVLVFGGSLGARSINHAATEAFADAPYRVLHVAGRRDFPDLAAPGPHYVLRDYVVPFGKALAAADIAVARAGGSVFELAQYGLPSVLIPYPRASGNHQTANARWMEQAGAATILPDAELTPQRLRAEVDALANDDDRRRAMAAAARALARPDAARTIAREVLDAAAAT
jgi:UDP-N-acetylglucosamine--N-acetylmuramyl-(pentapeptide) pyrophosphoryl-undecaprenol N-acetylglucosamine transferase